MGVYFASISLATASALFAELLKDKEGRCHSASHLFLIISAVALAFPLMIRSVGVDYENYVISYESITVNTFGDYWKYVWNGRPEPLFVVICFFAKYLFDSFCGVNIICGLITVLFTYLMIFQWKDDVELTAVVWFVCVQYYLFAYGLNRMMMSVAIVGWTYRLFLDKKYKAVFFWILIAGLVQYSAFLMLFFYPIAFMVKKRASFVVGLKPAAVAFFSALIFYTIIRIAPVLFGGFSWFARYLGYLSVDINLGALNNNLLCYLVLIWLFLYAKAEFADDDGRDFLPFVYLFAALCLISVVIPVHRAVYFFYPCVALISGLLSKNMNGKLQHKQLKFDTVLFWLLILLFGCLWTYRLLAIDLNWSPFLVPYKSFLAAIA